MTQWYISTYVRLYNGAVELLSYTKAANRDIALEKERMKLPNNQFYYAETRVGSKLPTFKPFWVARAEYSHKPKTADLQAEAEIKAYKILNAEDVDFAETKQVLKNLKGLLTKAQYDVVFQAIMRKPSVMKYLYERSER